ncbi:TolC family protein [uncultured Hymenobacter sp.]|uniref:TolC family protein n=1 Tax=uncultured Hymenobacter sp. TaxID=170016 RepID=UPI0035C9CB80
MAGLLALHTSLALAQTKPAPTESWQTIFFDSPTVALPRLTAAAIQHSASLKSLEISKSISQEQAKLARKSLYNIVAVGANYSYGNLFSFGGNQAPSPGVEINNAPRYSVNANLSIPLSLLVNRGNTVRIADLSIQSTEAARQDRVDQLRQQVIELYQTVVLARKVLTLQQEALVNARTNYQLSERQFRQGQLTLPEISSANSQLTSASIAQESARNQYDTAFLILEEIVGAKISTLMTTR